MLHASFDEVVAGLGAGLVKDVPLRFGCSVSSEGVTQLKWKCIPVNGNAYPDQITAFAIRVVQGKTIVVIDPPRAYWGWLSRDVELGTKIILAQDPNSIYAIGGRFIPKTSKTTRYFGGDTKISNLVAFNAVVKAAGMPELDPSK